MDSKGWAVPQIDGSHHLVLERIAIARGLKEADKACQGDGVVRVHCLCFYAKLSHHTHMANK